MCVCVCVWTYRKKVSFTPTSLGGESQAPSLVCFYHHHPFPDSSGSGPIFLVINFSLFYFQERFLCVCIPVKNEELLYEILVQSFPEKLRLIWFSSHIISPYSNVLPAWLKKATISLLDMLQHVDSMSSVLKSDPPAYQ